MESEGSELESGEAKRARGQEAPRERHPASRGLDLQQAQQARAEAFFRQQEMFARSFGYDFRSPFQAEALNPLIAHFRAQEQLFRAQQLQQFQQLQQNQLRGNLPSMVDHPLFNLHPGIVAHPAGLSPHPSSSGANTPQPPSTQVPTTAPTTPLNMSANREVRKTPSPTGTESPHSHEWTFQEQFKQVSTY